MPGTPPEADDAYTGVRRRYVFGLFCQSLGTGMTALTSSFLIFHQTGHVFYVALIMVMTNVPQLVLAPVANRLARRWGGPTLYVVSWGSSYALNLVPFTLGLLGHLSTTTLLLWYVGQGIVIGIGSPAAGLLRTEISPPGGSSEFNAAATRAIASATMFGILAGGAALAVVGPSWIYLGAAISGIPIILAVLPVCRTFVVSATSARSRLADALVAQRTNPEVRAAFRFALVVFLLSGYAVTLPSLASNIGTRAIYLSSLQAANVFGGLFVVVGVRYIHRRTSWLGVQRACVAVAAVAVLYLGWVAFRGHQPLWFLATAVLAIVPLGFVLNLDSAVLNAAIQVVAPADVRAPVMTAYALVPVAAVPVSQLVIAGMSDLVSVGFSLAVVGGLTLVLVLLPHRGAARAALTALDAEHVFPEAGLADTLTIGGIEAAGLTIPDQVVGPEVPGLEEREF